MAVESRNIEIHKFSIAPLRQVKNTINLSDNNFNLYNKIISEFKAFIYKIPKNENGNRVISINKNKDSKKESWFENNTHQIISGKISTGEYGKTGTVTEYQKGERVPIFDIETNHAVERPFYFMILIPKNKKYGFIFLERDGQFGIKGIFTNTLAKFIAEKLQNHKLHTSPLVNEEIVKKYITNGELKSIILTRNSLPINLEDSIGISKLNHQEFEIKIEITAKGSNKFPIKFKNKALKILEGSTGGFFTHSAFNDLGLVGSCKTKIKSKYQDKKRNIDLSDTMKFKPYYEIMVKIDSDGHSNFNSIDKKVIELADDLVSDFI